ncbi:hypothetical protein ACFP7A_00945 [Sporolactobacillus kofuensis]|uniref:Uncharacterized protein n=1 Tax=Sporolactobacillus kofuensis TaxID=269672 RepID=A0ABW1WCE2_9BACL|nr:hypothetical protein [Sporolactobacillus kofuensis]MCO7175531.1 hypothetical protein [Sporolactobacillus kofuensis]
MYRVVDHIHGCKKTKYDTINEALAVAFRLAQMQTIFSNKRIHLSVMDGSKQAIDINVNQREEAK